MMRSGRPGARGQLVIDVALVVWTATWLWMGVAVAREVRGIGDPLLYVPRRLALRRERRALSRAIAGGRTPELDELLAERAVVHLAYHRLRRVSGDPRGDLRDGRHAALADAELEWFGVLPESVMRRVSR